MAEDLYKILGVKRGADADDIRKAYRAQAKKLHPDVNPGDRAAEDKFKKIAAAYDILGDAEKRAKYDAGEIDAEGQETPRRFYREYAEAPAGGPYRSAAGFEDIGDVFGDLFGAGARRGGRFDVKFRGGDLHYTLTVDFLDALKGARRRVTMADGKALDIAIPAGLRDGQILRLKGKGMAGAGGGEPGDAFIETRVAPHPFYRREDNDVILELPVTVAEAALGGKVKVPTPWGPVTMTIPADSNSGTTLRLKGKGAPKAHGRPAGDQIVRLTVVLPDKADAKLAALLREWSESHPYNPRRAMGV